MLHPLLEKSLQVDDQAAEKDADAHAPEGEDPLAVGEYSGAFS
jgi:hypothetical protein